MTTRVLIVNLGPDEIVNLREQSGNNTPYYLTSIPVGNYRDVHLWGGENGKKLILATEPLAPTANNDVVVPPSANT